MTAAPSLPAPAGRRILAHGLYETRNVLRNGEQLLVSLVLPLLVLFGASRLELITSADVPSIDVITPGVLALAVMASAFTGQGIATGFERQYGALAYLSTTPLGPVGLIAGKVCAVMCVVAIQAVVLGTAAVVMGWTPDAAALPGLLLGMFLGACVFTALGLLLAGTVRAEATLALSNVLWVLMGAAGGAVFPLPENLGGTILQVLPSAALGEVLRIASLDGAVALQPLLILTVWGVLALLAAKRWFTWT